MMMRTVWRKTLFQGLRCMFLLLGAQGCVATRDWVSEKMTLVSEKMTLVSEQMTLLVQRVSRTEERVNQMENRLSGVESLVGRVDAKAEKAVSGLSNLRLEKRVVLLFKEGANFAFNSPALTDQAKRDIDSFFSDLKGDLEGTNSAIFLIAGHTDNTGTDEYNYELGRKRARSVARYLITEKKIDPLRVDTVTYGKSTPLADNGTREGRSKNRRVEILVYKEAIASASSAETGPRAEGKTK